MLIQNQALENAEHLQINNRKGILVNKAGRKVNPIVASISNDKKQNVARVKRNLPITNTNEHASLSPKRNYEGLDASEPHSVSQ